MRQIKLVRYFCIFKGNLSDKSVHKSSEITKKDAVDKSVIQTIKDGNFPPKNTKFVWIGPPHAVSNLRRIVYNEQQNESKLERDFRLKRIQLQEWNQQFWENHNNTFYKCKEEFIEKRKKEIYGTEKKYNNKPLSSDEMSTFYKKFLNEKHEIHLNYNKEWYKKNIGLLFPAIKVFFYQIWKKRIRL